MHGGGAPSPWLLRWAHLLPAGGNALDLACGAGRHLRWLAGLGLHPTGIDRDPAALQACRDLAAKYPHDDLFRSRVVMARHGFGRGEYRYFAYPLPPQVEQLRTALYSALVPVANRWHAAMGLPVRFPDRHAEFMTALALVGSSVERWAQAVTAVAA